MQEQEPKAGDSRHSSHQPLIETDDVNRAPRGLRRHFIDTAAGHRRDEERVRPHFSTR
jgi:hypothetical protein